MKKINVLLLSVVLPVLAVVWFAQFKSLHVVRVENQSAAPLRHVRVEFVGGFREVPLLDPGRVLVLRFSSMGTSGTVRLTFDDGKGHREFDCGYYWVLLFAELVDVRIDKEGKLSCGELPILSSQ